MTEKKLRRVPKTLINDCYALELYHIPSASTLESQDEHSTVISNQYELACLYVSANNDNKITVKVINDDGKKLSEQTIELDKKRITFGIRRYFKCACGREVNSLYLKGGRFACRHCHELIHEITRLHKGTFFYKLNRTFKIKSAEHLVGNVNYGGKMTRKARQYMRLIEKYT